MNAILTVDGRLRVPGAVRPMNFGQHWRTAGVQELGYELTLPISALRDVLESELDQIVADAKKFPDDDDEFEIALRHQNWPSVGKIVEDPALQQLALNTLCLLYTSPSPRDGCRSRMPSSA